MKANELRIGNYIFIIDEDGNKEPLQVDLNDICDIESSIDKETHEHIPLTEQWLLDFGFVNIESKFYKSIICIAQDKSGLFWFEYSVQRIEIKTVNHIQNVYYFLTGNELNK